MACPRADLAQLNQAVAAAKAAFPAWSAKPLSERAALLNKLADAIDARAPELAPILTQEQGKPLGGAFYEIMIAAANIRGFTAMDLPETVLQEDEQSKVIRQRLPLGVVAAITPWNFPLIMAVTKLAPRAAGRQHAGAEAGADHAAGHAEARRDLRGDLSGRRRQRDRRCQRLGWAR